MSVKNKRKRIGVMGSTQIEHIIPLLEMEYEVINIQEMLDSEKNAIIRFWKFCKTLAYIDILYVVFVYSSFWKRVRMAHIFNKKVYGHWIGTDSKLAAEGNVDIRTIKNIDGHITCFEPLKEQLHAIGVHSVVIPIVPFKVDFTVCNMPPEHRVLIYMPKGKEASYGYDEIYPIIKEFKNIKFDIVANDDIEKFGKLDNVKLWGWVSHEEMESIYNSISIVIRIHENDGLSMSVLEAMAKGKKVIWNCKFEKCYIGTNYKEIKSSLQEIIKNPPEVDKDAHDFIVDNYSKNKILEMYRELWG